MQGLATFWQQTDSVGRAVALVLLLMSLSTWAVIFWKSWVLTRARRDLRLGVAMFWRAADLASAQSALQHIDRDGVLLPLIAAVQVPASPGTLATRALPEAQFTRHLRDSLQTVLARLQAGQVLLASVGAVSPFVGLFGTVWGVFHAMQAIGQSGSASLDQVAGPVGEALIMTAAGLAVAIPAVLAYNLFGKLIAACEADLEGFALDLRDTLLAQSA
ncbi:MAG: MotA/TolQ/ExbB proton channel family protein [Aquabacterium sp.]|jgi:biopolymer transport protein ExbB|uniref:MotA/TolQ/ExbB proton channel family protein n=1 Tax=Aquabacterium sp. TaxID=1872578 RepID=UPI001B44ECF9|nr:MotA/TolQ/ExbB proton channel family protein [Aquabacterium sp.]MBP7131786.1 MotA/TolQ/ExbB proton channel family protein [Aquabacterium sp.]MBP9063209.1 MotA/TolQ/ExbB proton channel family protein [Aquabacterium sp.]